MILTIKDIIIYILCITIIILYINKKNRFLNTFSNSDDLKKYVENDKLAMTNILTFLNNIKNDTYNINNMISVDKLTVKNNLTVNNKENIISNNIKINIDDISRTELGLQNNRILDIFPRYTIILYHGTNIQKLPKRWVLCDGKTWYVYKKYMEQNRPNPMDVGFSLNDTDQKTKQLEQAKVEIFVREYKASIGKNMADQYDIKNDYDIVEVPDLRGRMIIGSDGKKYEFKINGGSDRVILENKHLPAHIHPTSLVMNTKEYDGKPSMFKISDFGPNLQRLDIDLNGSGGDYLMDIDKYGNFGYGKYKEDASILYEGAYPHENMPPYLVSRYIMKL